MSEAAKIRLDIAKWLDGNIIDIGCGDDKICDAAIGVDNRPNTDANLIWDASKHLPFDDGTFDTIFSSHTIEDMSDPALTLDEWLRILREDGTIILYWPNPKWYPKVGTPLANKAHTRDYTLKEMEDILLFKTHYEVEILYAEERGPEDGIYVYEKRDRIEYSSLIIAKRQPF